MGLKREQELQEELKVFISKIKKEYEPNSSIKAVLVILMIARISAVSGEIANRTMNALSPVIDIVVKALEPRDEKPPSPDNTIVH